MIYIQIFKIRLLKLNRLVTHHNPSGLILKSMFQVHCVYKVYVVIAPFWFSMEHL